MKYFGHRKGKYCNWKTAFAIVVRNNWWELATDYLKFRVRFTYINDNEDKNLEIIFHSIDKLFGIKIWQKITIIYCPGPWIHCMICWLFPIQVPVPRSNSWYGMCSGCQNQSGSIRNMKIGLSIPVNNFHINNQYEYIICS